MITIPCEYYLQYLQSNWNDDQNLYPELNSSEKTINYHRRVAWSSGQPRRLPLQGSRDRISVVPLSFICSQPERRGVRHEKKCKSTKGGPQRRELTNAGAANRRRKTSRRFRNGYEKGFRFELAIWLNGERRLKIDMVRKY